MRTYFKQKTRNTMKYSAAALLTYYNFSHNAHNVGSCLRWFFYEQFTAGGRLLSGIDQYAFHSLGSGFVQEACIQETLGLSVKFLALLMVSHFAVSAIDAGCAKVNLYLTGRRLGNGRNDGLFPAANSDPRQLAVKAAEARLRKQPTQ